MRTALELKMDSVDTNNICRTCLSQKDLIELFSADKCGSGPKHDIVSFVDRCYNVKIRADDEVSTKICNKCVHMVSLFMSSQTYAQSADSYLHHIYRTKRLSSFFPKDAIDLGSIPNISTSFVLASDSLSLTPESEVLPTHATIEKVTEAVPANVSTEKGIERVPTDATFENVLEPLPTDAPFENDLEPVPTGAPLENASERVPSDATFEQVTESVLPENTPITELETAIEKPSEENHSTAGHTRSKSTKVRWVKEEIEMKEIGTKIDLNNILEPQKRRARKLKIMTDGTTLENPIMDLKSLKNNRKTSYYNRYKLLKTMKRKATRFGIQSIEDHAYMTKKKPKKSKNIKLTAENVYNFTDAPSSDLDYERVSESGNSESSRKTSSFSGRFYKAVDRMEL